jgi:16S rRNA (guanine527-N7)-methyltransferase
MSEFRDALYDLAPSFDLVLDDGLVDRLERHFELLVRWNSKMNLTRITEPAAAARFHYLESVWVGTFLPASARVLDVGSGAGFPGIPLASSRPDLTIRLLEPNLKRSTFLRESVRMLALESVSVVSDRFDPSIVAPTDIVVSRALEGLDALLPSILASSASDVLLLCSAGVVAALGPLGRSLISTELPLASNRFLVRFGPTET